MGAGRTGAKVADMVQEQGSHLPPVFSYHALASLGRLKGEKTQEGRERRPAVRTPKASAQVRIEKDEVRE